jgi:glycosyltransferase involved in cell wall biosynthesis
MKTKVLVVGQTPPPYGGQAMMILRLVNANFRRIEIVHVRMSFSDSFKSVGKISGAKILYVPTLIWKIIWTRFQKKASILYFPPAGPNLNPVLRDIAILFFIRPFFAKTIFHFRAAGVSEFVRSSNFLVRYFAKLVYNKPDMAIQLSRMNPPDGAYFKARKIAIVMNGLEDAALPFLPLVRNDNRVARVVSVGVIKESKGIFVLLEALRLLRARSISVHFTCVGDFDSVELEQTVKAKCKEWDIENYTAFLGVKIGADKWNEYAKADIFCFPTFFEAESFGNVAVEAMMFELPVVATMWRGIPDIVDDGKTGFLVPVHDPIAVASKIEILISNPSLRKAMGIEGRHKFLKYFTLAKHLEKMEDLFVNL